MVHHFNPDMAPDSEYAPGVLKHLVVGNRGRTLDSRRTPVTIVGLTLRAGYFVVRVEDFEDKGALWEVPLEKVGNYQFELQSALAPEPEVDSYTQIISRLDRSLSIPRDLSKESETRTALKTHEQDAMEWIEANSTFFAAGKTMDTSISTGPPQLRHDFLVYMKSKHLETMETEFAARFVSNPYSGEMIKGHRIVLAELGLVSFKDKAVRDPDLFEPPWDKNRRRLHILTRMGFIRGMFKRAGIKTLTLYRGFYCQGVPEPQDNKTFVSSSFDFEIAKSCYSPRETTSTGVLLRQVVPVERVFMTYLETEPMNQQFLEAEAVLLFEEGNAIF